MYYSLYHGDCLDVLPAFAAKGIKVDAIITDLPYGVTTCGWDTVIPFQEMWQGLSTVRRAHTPVLLFGNEPFSSCLRLSNSKEYRYDIYWQKERATNIFQVKRRPAKVIENISVFYKKQPVYNPQMSNYNGPKRTNKIKDGKLGILIDNQNRKPFEYEDKGTRYPLQIVQYRRDILTSSLHPTQKPVALMEYLIKTFTNENDTVLDFAMGSGSTGIACQNTNRNFIGIEVERKYFDVAKLRMDTNIS